MTVVYRLGREIFNERVIFGGRDRRVVAFVLVALNTTDPRSAGDALFAESFAGADVVAESGICLAASGVVGRWWRAARHGVLARARKHVERGCRFSRSDFGFALFRTVRQRKFMAGNAIVLLLIVLAMLLVPSRLESTTLGGHRAPATPLAIPSSSQPAPVEGVWTRAINQIRDRRGGFRYYAQESNIGGEVQFNSASDIVWFVPRAAVVGFFAPFPRMWFAAGSYGAAGRVLSGLETLAMYVLYIAVGVTLWRERRRLAMWLVFLTASAGLIGLGLVVVNAGALYRLRYVFWIMLIVIAAQGIYLTTRRTTATKS